MCFQKWAKKEKRIASPSLSTPLVTFGPASPSILNNFLALIVCVSMFVCQMPTIGDAAECACGLVLGLPLSAIVVAAGGFLCAATSPLAVIAGATLLLFSVPTCLCACNDSCH
jgi:hypothetical protein